jgi:hypothetical protein
MSDKVFILDEIVVKPGFVQAYRDQYIAKYAPGARSRGMCLESIRITPPLELQDQPNTLHILWSVANVAAWWTMRLGGGDRPFDPAGTEKGGWWAEAADLTVSRRRSVMVDYAAAS